MKTFIIAAVATAAIGAQSPIATRVVEREPFFREPTTHCDVPRMVVLIANAVLIPAGVELVPGKCEPFSSAGERVFIQGLTVAAALDKVVALDARYRWKDADGVIVLRPVDAWGDAAHYLHETVASFDYEDMNMGMGWALVQQVLGPHKYPLSAIEHARETSPDGTRRFAVRLPPLSRKIDILNGIARAHGAMLWEIDYCAPVAHRHAATIKFMGQGTSDEPEKRRVGLFGPGISGGRVYTTDKDGQRVSPCEPPERF